MKIKVELKWQNMWIGAYWQNKRTSPQVKVSQVDVAVSWIKEFHIWICVVPCLPLHIWWRLK